MLHTTYNVPPYLRKGRGIQRAPGDKSGLKTKQKAYHRVCSRGGVLSRVVRYVRS